jgi:hypothetical protein
MLLCQESSQHTEGMQHRAAAPCSAQWAHLLLEARTWTAPAAAAAAAANLFAALVAL